MTRSLKNQNKFTESLLTKYWPDEILAEDILDKISSFNVRNFKNLFDMIA
jgi:hypothetical protein